MLQRNMRDKGLLPGTPFYAMAQPDKASACEVSDFSKIHFIYNPSDDLKASRNSDKLRKSGKALLAGDIASLCLAFICGGLAAWALDRYLLTGDFQPLFSLETLTQFCIFAGLASLALLWVDMRGHYRQRLPFWEVAGHIVMITLIGFLVCGFVQFVAQSSFSRLWLGLSWSLFGFFIFAGRHVIRRYLQQKGKWQIPAVMIGKGPSAEAAIGVLKQDVSMGFEIVAHISSEGLGQLSRPHAWKRLLSRYDAGYIFLALEGGELEAQYAAVKALFRERLPCSIVPPWQGLPASGLSPHHFMMSDVLMLHDTNRLRMALPCFLKRGFDIAVSACALIALAPLLLMIAMMIRSDGGPSFFTQPRVGKNGRLFDCYKFRSMRIDAEKCLGQYLAEHPEAAEEWKHFQKLKNDVRITKFGHFIRRTSLDELPQLLNVLKGDMSLVGPRPITPGQEDFYADDFIYYECVRPGITGPWQVSGRNKLTFKQRVALEASYARNWSFWTDIVILIKTIPAVLKSGQAF